jgi:hypothetical protein
MASNSTKIKKSLNIEPLSSPTLTEQGDVGYNSTIDKVQVRGSSATRVLVEENSSATLTNKTIDADQNTITNIENADIKAGAAIDAAKIADGSVSNAEFQRLDGVTSPIQTQLDGKLGTTLNNGQIFVGNVSNVATAVTPSGDVTVSNTGDIQIVAGAISDTEVNASANIARTKLAAGTADHVVINNGSGVLSSEAQLAVSRGGTGTSDRTLQDNVASVSVDWQSRQLRTGSTVKLDWSGTDIDVNSRKIINVATPTAANDAANKLYVDNLAAGAKWKNAVRVATTANISSLSGLLTVDGITLVANDRVLVKNQTAQENNGIYVAASGAWSRASDMDSWVEVPAAAMLVQEGSVNGDTAWICTSDDGGTLGTTPITFVSFPAGAAYTADGQGIELVALQFQLELDGSTLSKSGAGLKVADGGISNTQVSNTAAIAYSKLSLTDSIVNADINSAAGIAYSKLSLSNSIVNGDIATSAAIARTKLAAGTANHIVVNDGSGVLSSTATLDIARGGTGQTSQTAAFDALAPSTTKGDLIAHNGTDNVRLGVGTDGQVLVANSAAATGLSWAAVPSAATGDINLTSFAGANNVATPANVTGLAFANGTVRAFKALVSVHLDATSDAFEVFELMGVQRGADWSMSATATGDVSGVDFTITSAGQVQYTSPNAAGFVSLTIKFRAQVTTV